MLEEIQSFITSYEKSIANWKDKVEQTDPTLIKTMDYLQEMADIGESCKDMTEFWAKINEKDMMNVITRYITELAEAGLARDRAQGKLQVPTAEEYGKGYRDSYAAIENKDELPETCKIYERIFQLEEESDMAPEFMRKLAEEGLYVKMSSVDLAESFTKIIKQTEDQSQPVMAFHNESMAKMAEDAVSTAEIEYESQRLVELNRVELMIDQMFCHDIFFRVANPIASYLLTGSKEDLTRVRANYIFITDFFGVDMDELYSLPRIMDLIEKVLLPPLNEEKQVYTLESFIEEQKMVINKSLNGKSVTTGPSERKSIQLWEQTIPLEETLKAFRNPKRPDEFMT